jgi:hypothetical protein
MHEKICVHCGVSYKTKKPYRGGSPCCPDLSCYTHHLDRCSQDGYPRQFRGYYGIREIEAFVWKREDQVRLKIRAIKHLCLSWLPAVLAELVEHYLDMTLDTLKYDRMTCYVSDSDLYTG